VDRPDRHEPPGFRIIGGFKLLGGLLCLATGVGLFRLLNRDVGEGLENAVAMIRLDPQSHYLHSAISWVSGVPRGRLKAVGFGTFFYAALYLVEGTGLLLQRHWAGYLTVVATGSLIPLEGYEVVVKPNAIKAFVLIINVAIVAYLVWKLVEERRVARKEVGVRSAANVPAT
jgi:uncharacterized membrane protein (DUF2068 family)